MTDPKLGLVRVADNLMLLRSGGRSKVPTELLEKPEFGRLILQLKKKFDLIVIDSPPLGAVTDSLLIAEQTDEVIYVCRFNRAMRKHIMASLPAASSIIRTTATTGATKNITALRADGDQEPTRGQTHSFH